MKMAQGFKTKQHVRRWLVNLRFSQEQHQKGVYVDGHERDDVVECTGIFLTQMVELDKKSLTSMAIPRKSQQKRSL